MEREARELHSAEPQARPDRIEVGPERQNPHEHDGRGDGRAFEILHLAGAARQLFRRDVVAGEAGHSARDEEAQDDTVVQPLHAAGVGQHGRRHPERDHIRQRVQLPAHGRGFLAPAGDTPVQDVENQRREDEPAGDINAADVLRLQVRHAREQRARAADGIAQGEPVREVELADHRERLAGPFGRLDTHSSLFFSCSSSSRARRVARSSTSFEGMPVRALFRRLRAVPAMNATTITVTMMAVSIDAVYEWKLHEAPEVPAKG